MPVEDVVNRACDIASIAFNQFRELEWLEPVPTLAELEEEIQAREDKRENDK